jgi:hypothetical protein
LCRMFRQCTPCVSFGEVRWSIKLSTTVNAEDRRLDPLVRRVLRG